MDYVAWVQNRTNELANLLVAATLERRQQDMDELCGAIKDYQYALTEWAKMTAAQVMVDAPFLEDSAAEVPTTEGDNT